MLGRDAILGFKDDQIGRVEVAELGGEVCIARLTVAEMDKISKLDGSNPASVEVVILGACDEDGTRLFSEKDRLSLAKLPATVIGIISKAVLDHNGMGQQAAAKND